MSRLHKKVIVCSAIVLAVLALSFLVWRGLTYEIIAHDATNMPFGGPQNVANGAYYSSYLFRAYECDISEERFLQFAEAKGWKIKPIQNGEPFEVVRYTANLSPFDNVYRKIKTGYYYSDYDGELLIGYDSDEKRLYWAAFH